MNDMHNENELLVEALPHSLTMEQAVISGLLTGEGWDDVSGILTEADFYSPRHSTMYRAIASMHGIG
ncbi:MAG TPA: DnaB-like helicase N-terminal domain-containing protein, partial [Candidatus Avimonas sp.]|nr:DnaB-like helicase N-terminal domain-containing protein [Candidatus Avimonas sp.]